MIDILVPVLGRPQNAKPLVDSIESATTLPHLTHFLCSPGDDEQIEACYEAGRSAVHVMLSQAGPGDYAKKMNYGYRVTTQPFILLAADDLDFQPGWDTKALAAADKTGAGVIGLNDCANPRVQRGMFSTHPLVRRSYVDEQGGSWDGPGVLVHEGYDHNYPDVELCELAKARGEWVFVKDARVCHRHPGFDRSVDDDATYEKGRAKFREDGRLFVKRQREWARQSRVRQRVRRGN